MSNIETILEYIATIQLGVTLPDGKKPKQAYAYVPADPSSADCPFFVNIVSGGTTEISGLGQQQVSTTILMKFCVARLESDSNVIALQKNVYQWRDAVLSTFAQKIRLGNDLNFILDAYINRWSIAEDTLTEQGTTKFACLTFSLIVAEWFPQTIGA